MSLRLSRELSYVSGVRMHAWQRWRTAAAAPRRSAILADVISRAEHATAKCRLPCCDSTLLFITPFPDSLSRLSDGPSLPFVKPISPFPSFSSFHITPCTHRRRRRVQTFAFQLRNEARHPTRDTHVKWRNLIERRYSPVAVGVEAEAVHRFLSLLFLFHSCGDCGGGDYAYRLPDYL